MRERQFSQTLLNIGFVFALVLAAICLGASVWYLSYFLISTSTGIEEILKNTDPVNDSKVRFELAVQGRTVMARLALLSCGIFIGMSLGFLGFALFLLGVKGEIDAEGKVESYSVKIARVSPGVFVILCASILIGVCATRSIKFDYERQTIPVPNNSNRVGTQQPNVNSNSGSDNSTDNGNGNRNSVPELPDPGNDNKL